MQFHIVARLTPFDYLVETRYIHNIRQSVTIPSSFKSHATRSLAPYFDSFPLPSFTFAAQHSSLSEALQFALLQMYRSYCCLADDRNNFTQIVTSTSFSGIYDAISEVNTHLSVPEKLWATWYAWWRNDTLATGMSFLPQRNSTITQRSLIPRIVTHTLLRNKS